MSSVILDANYILAVLDEKDAFYKTASGMAENISAAFDNIVFLDCVVNEVVSVFVKRLKERKQISHLPAYLEKLQTLIPRSDITWVYPAIERYYDRIIETIMNSHGVLNFHDALILHAANEYEIKHIISFDKGFDKTKLQRIKDVADI